MMIFAGSPMRAGVGASEETGAGAGDAPALPWAMHPNAGAPRCARMRQAMRAVLFAPVPSPSPDPSTQFSALTPRRAPTTFAAFVAFLAFVACMAFVSLAAMFPAAAQARRATSTATSGEERVIVHAVVSYVVDGDSLWVQTMRHDGADAALGRQAKQRAGQRLRLRLRGIDAPELCQRGGVQSRDALRALAPAGRRARVILHARDRYGRAIADVVLMPDEVDLSRRMIEQGWAWSDDWGRRLGPHAQAHRQAVQARRGLFGAADAERPADFRRRHGPCAAALSMAYSPSHRCC